jgi:mobilome CxxCx(11)CxxC protein
LTLTSPDKTWLTQARLNSLAAKHLYDRRIGNLRRASTLADYLAIAVPVLYFPIRYLAKETTAHDVLEGVWEILAAILIAATLLKVFYHWSEKSESQATARSENVKIADEILHLLNTSEGSEKSEESVPVVVPPALKAELDLIHFAVKRQDVDDQRELGELKTEERKRAYREALKELVPGDANVKCPICQSSPWAYKSGSCNACGNTPVEVTSR